MKRRIVFNSVLSIISTLIPTFALQFIILPKIATRVTPEFYGQVIATIALLNLSSGTLGNVLDNSKLISHKEYEAKKLEGDFNIIYVHYIIINVILISLIAPFYGNSVFSLGYVMLLLIGPLYLTKEYAAVEYKLEFNYLKVMYNRIILTVGYLIGFMMFFISGYWELIYLLGVLLSLGYIVKTTSVLSEPYQKSENFDKAKSQTNSLLVSGLLVSSITYLDKLLLFPLLGGLTTSVYYVSTILGRMMSMMIEPVNGVLLSYISRLTEFRKKNFNLMLLSTLLIGFIAYIVVILTAKPVLKFLYPEIYLEALNYLGIVTMTGIIIVVCNLLNTVVLKFVDTRMQIIINGSYLFFYLIITLLLLSKYGLFGFCYGTLFAAVGRLFFITFIYYTKTK